jgi:hypothetical protein
VILDDDYRVDAGGEAFSVGATKVHIAYVIHCTLQI